MVEDKLVVNNKTGLHARPAALLTQISTKFKSEITICTGIKQANAKSIMSLMALAAGQGAEVTVKANGCDENEALEAIRKLFVDNFGE